MLEIIFTCFEEMLENWINHFVNRFELTEGEVLRSAPPNSLLTLRDLLVSFFVKLVLRDVEAGPLKSLVLIPERLLNIIICIIKLLSASHL